MADNVAITAGAGTTIAADDVGGVLHQRVKLSVGSDGVATDMTAGAGAVTAGTPRVTLASDDPAVASVALSATALGAPADAAWVAGSGSAIALLKALATQALSAVAALVTPVPRATANGATSSRINAAASNNLTNLKASAGNVLAIDVFNVAAYTVFLKLYNKATAPVVATDTPVWTIPIPAGTGYSKTFAMGKSFATGIAYAIVKLQADTDATNVVALDLTGSIDWI